MGQRKNMPFLFSLHGNYGILAQKEVFRLKDNRINFDLERKLRRYAISDLMKYIVIGQGIVFALLYIWPTLGYRLYSLITLTRAGLMRGQIWRLVTFVFVPPSSSPIFILFALYFYYMIGIGLENQWGKVKFNLYYLVGMLGSIIAALITGYADNAFLNLSLFFAYAALYPDQEVLLFMILPITIEISCRCGCRAVSVLFHRRRRIHAGDHRALPAECRAVPRRGYSQHHPPRIALLENALQLPQNYVEEVSPALLDKP